MSTLYWQGNALSFAIIILHFRVCFKLSYATLTILFAKGGVLCV